MVDYSKWDKMTFGDSDDDDDETARTYRQPTVKKFDKGSTITIGKNGEITSTSKCKPHSSSRSLLLLPFGSMSQVQFQRVVAPGSRALYKFRSPSIKMAPLLLITFKDEPLFLLTTFHVGVTLVAISRKGRPESPLYVTRFLF
jgi:hypothetical protein